MAAIGQTKTTLLQQHIQLLQEAVKVMEQCGGVLSDKHIQLLNYEVFGESASRRLLGGAGGASGDAEKIKRQLEAFVKAERELRLEEVSNNVLSEAAVVTPITPHDNLFDERNSWCPPDTIPCAPLINNEVSEEARLFFQCSTESKNRVIQIG